VIDKHEQVSEKQAATIQTNTVSSPRNGTLYWRRPFLQMPITRSKTAGVSIDWRQIGSVDAAGCGTVKGRRSRREPLEFTDQDCETAERRRLSALLENQRRCSAAFSYQRHFDLRFHRRLSTTDAPQRIAIYHKLTDAPHVSKSQTLMAFFTSTDLVNFSPRSLTHKRLFLASSVHPSVTFPHGLAMCWWSSASSANTEASACDLGRIPMT
jgi:hypothetical protein